MTRKTLPQRRYAETFNMTFGGQNREYTVTVGYYGWGTREVGEVFITGAKTGSDAEAIARDGAILLSIALQFGAPLETIAHAITREGNGAPSTIIGAVIDRLKGPS